MMRPMRRPRTPDLAEWDEIWISEEAIGELMHITPVNDLVAHELDPDCVCGPYWEDLGKGNFLVAHHALDGRP